MPASRWNWKHLWYKEKLDIDFTLEKRYIAFKGINNTSKLELLLEKCKPQVDDKNPLDVYKALHTMQNEKDENKKALLKKSYRYRNLVYKTDPAAVGAVGAAVAVVPAVAPGAVVPANTAAAAAGAVPGAVVVSAANQYTSTVDKHIEAINTNNLEEPYNKENLKQIIKYIRMYTDTFHDTYNRVNSYIIINNITSFTTLKIHV